MNNLQHIVAAGQITSAPELQIVLCALLDENTQAECINSSSPQCQALIALLEAIPDEDNARWRKEIDQDLSARW